MGSSVESFPGTPSAQYQLQTRGGVHMVSKSQRLAQSPLHTAAIRVSVLANRALQKTASGSHADRSAARAIEQPNAQEITTRRAIDVFARIATFRRKSEGLASSRTCDLLPL
jgi:hypothetical protein